MSYILEALKKSQSERQLGSAPTLHVMQVGASMHSDGTVRRTPLAIALGVIALAAALAAGAWHFKASERKAAAPPAAAHAAARPAASAVPAPPPLAVVPPSAPAEAPTIGRAAQAPVPETVATAAPAPLAVMPASKPASKPPAPAPVKAAAPAAPPPIADQDETLQTLRHLPETIQRSVPSLVFGGYMYSSNPADRLVLIDKTLRHEGEEVAPGLVLEKLLPKGAVMNYRGNRYRVPF